MKKLSDCIIPARAIVYVALGALGIVFLPIGSLCFEPDSAWHDIFLGIGTGFITSVVTGAIFDYLSYRKEIRSKRRTRSAYLYRTPNDLRDLIAKCIDFYLSFKVKTFDIFNGMTIADSLDSLYKEILSLKGTELGNEINSKFVCSETINGVCIGNVLSRQNYCFINGISEESLKIKSSESILRSEGIFTDEEIAILSALKQELEEIAKQSLFEDFLDFFTAILPYLKKVPEINSILSQKNKFRNGRAFDATF